MATNQFYPRYRNISAITNANPAVVSFSDADHDFTIGEYVSFRVTRDFGMFQINERRALVTATAATTITIDLDSTSWDAFDLSNLNAVGTSPPLCVPCCSGVVPGTDIPETNLVDAFDNRRV